MTNSARICATRLRSELKKVAAESLLLVVFRLVKDSTH